MKFLIALILLFNITGAFAQGDDCATAINISSNGCSGAGAFDNTGIAGTLAAPGCFTGGTNNGMWLSFTAVTEVAEIVINGTTMANPQVTLLEPPAGGCGGGTFTLLDCQSPGGAATINYSSLVIGDTYYLFVDGQNNEEGTFEACITSLSAPLNDDPCSPFTIPANNFCSAAGAYTNVGATPDDLLSVGFPACFDAGAFNTVYFEFVATGPFNEIIIDGGGTDMQLSVLQTGNCSGTAWSSPGASGCASGSSPVTMNANNLVIGETYLIAVDGVGDATSAFQICLNSYVPTAGPPNDDCVNAIALCPGQNYTATTEDATNTSAINDADWTCNAVLDNVIWYTYVANTPVEDVVFDLSGTSTGGDPVQFGVFEFTGGGSPCDNPGGNNFNGLECNSSILSSGSTTVTVSAADMTAGETYYINVDNWPGEVVTVDFTVTGNAGADAGPDVSMCSNDAATVFVGLQAGGAWSGPGVTAGGAFDPASVGPGIYTLFYTFGPCVDQKVVTVTSIAVTAITDVTICAGESADLSGAITTFPASGPTTISNTTAVTIPDNPNVSSSINITGITGANIGANPIVSVCLDIDHTFTADLDISLQCPNGTIINLTSDNGGGGNNYTGTCFTAAGPPITGGNAPFTGDFSPEDPLTDLNGCDINGTWTLLISDDSNGDTGTLNGWSMSFNNEPTFVWSPTTNMTNSTTLSPTVAPTVTTTYTLTGTMSGCTDSDQVTITVLPCATPTMDPAPADLPVACPSDVPAMVDLTWVDACAGTGVVTGVDVSNGATCPEIITRTWTYTNPCGNFVTETQIITINDIIDPVATGAVVTPIVGCAVTDAPAAVTTVAALETLGFTISDNCTADADLVVTSNDVVAGTCPIVITRTYTITDGCLNFTTIDQTINIDDQIDPVATGAVVTPIVGCAVTDAPAAVTTVAALETLGFTISDNCTADADLVVTSNDVVAGTCPIVITRTYTITDGCLNFTTIDQTINVDDQIDPVATGAVVTPIVGCAVTAAPAAVTTVAALETLGFTISDNCTADADLVVTSNDVVAGTCPIVITRTYTITDGCLNFTTIDQTINVDDQIDPVATGAVVTPIVGCAVTAAPAAVTTVAALETLGFTISDNCTADADLVVTSNDVVAGTCPIVITRTYTITDGCLNFTTIDQTINIDDTELPVVTGTPTLTAIEGCSIADLPAAETTVLGLEALVGMTSIDDACTVDADLDVTFSDAAPTGTCPITVVRTYTITDECDNEVEITHTITIDDTELPVVTGTPTLTAIEGCSIADLPEAETTVLGLEALVGMTSIDDACTVDADLDVTFSDAAPTGTCPITVVRTYTITDECDNEVEITHTITIIDTELPVVIGTPTLTAIEGCSIADLPAAETTVLGLEALVGMTSIDDACTVDADLDVTFSDAAPTGACPFTVVRTYKITDECNNEVEITHTITIDDNINPTGSAPDDFSIAGGAVPAEDINLVIDEADNCTVNPIVTFVDDQSDGGVCPEIITRTYRITDDCGNSIDVVQLITVGDAVIPTASDPDDINVECLSDVPAPDSTIVDDAADNGATPIVTFEDDVSDDNSCPETITRRYRVTDDCGNFIFVSHDIVVLDVTNPVFDAQPADIDYQCATDVPAVGDLAWNDNCDGAGVATATDATDGNTCPEVITRTWTYTDACNNIATVSQIITVHDTEIPVFDAQPADVTYQCATDVPAAGDLAWNDNCDGAGVATATDATDGNTCPEVITRTWTYTDACNNIATVSQIITVHDTEIPVFDAQPADVTYQCATDVPAAGDLAWNDNCDGAGVATATDATDGNTCPEVITRTWTYTDACNNVATVSQIITVHDTEIPVFDAQPADITYQCATDVPAAGDLAWNDNCDGTGVATATDATDGNTCPEVITRTWTYTDACNNVATVSQIITVHDTEDPTATDPATTTVPGGPAPAADINVVIDEADNCTVAPIVALVSESSDNNPCPETITRIYSVTDECGNTINVTHLILITDPTLPTGTAPGAINVECLGAVPAADPLLITDEADNQGVPTVAWEGDVSDNNTCPETIIRTYSITDLCLNVVLLEQIITVMDVTAPVMDVPPVAVSVQCIGDVPVMTDLGYTDNCDPTGTVTGTDVSDNNSCPETITRSWFYTDDCGNVSLTATQIITVHDTQAPIILGTPAAIAVQCIGDVPAMIDLGYTDNCDAAGTITGTDVSDNNTCPETITRTWTITDACGNNTTETQIITVHDTQSPVILGTPPAITVQCIGDLPAIIDLTWNDNCDGTGVTSGFDAPIVGDYCGGTITRTWSYTDACGNLASVSQVITVDDNINPTASNLPPLSVPGAIDVPAPNINDVFDEADNCTTNPTVTFLSDLSDGNVCNGEVITRTYVVTDDCGNFVLVTQQITIEAMTPPISVGDETICEGESITLTADNPSNADISWDQGIQDGVLFTPTQTLIYTVTAEDNGCFNTATSTVTVEETPVASFTASDPGCEPLTVTFTNTSTSTSPLVDCQWDIEGVSNSLTGCGIVDYNFANAGTYDVTLTVTSETGCTDSVTYSDFVDVYELPVASFTASETILSTLNTEVDFTNTSIGAASYEWSFGDETPTSNSENVSHTFPSEEDGGYVVTLVVTSTMGCVDSTTIAITVQEELIYYIPNTFTPDGDEYNNTFHPVFTSGYDPFDYNMLIFNRWGEIVFESNDTRFGWDGTYNGKMVQDGTYTWKIEFKQTLNDKRIMITGHVSIIR